jgi:hypothetical protein
VASLWSPVGRGATARSGQSVVSCGARSHSTEWPLCGLLWSEEPQHGVANLWSTLLCSECAMSEVGNLVVTSRCLHMAVWVLFVYLRQNVTTF